MNLHTAVISFLEIVKTDILAQRAQKLEIMESKIANIKLFQVLNDFLGCLRPKLN